MPAGAAPARVVEILAERKLRAVLELASDRPVLAADTLVFLDGAALGKPRDPAEARRMLASLSGREHEVLTGVALAAPAAGGPRIRVGHARTGVTFRRLSAAEIDAYVATGEPLDKAGAYALQGGAGAFVTGLDGPEDNVIGLPVAVVRQLMGKLGDGSCR